MSKFPSELDDDSTLPVVNDNINEIGGEAINALRDAVFEIEQNIGLNANGTTDSVSERLSVAFFPDGTLKPSAITSLGLVTLPITNSQISATAEIVESKLKLDYRTQDLFNYIRDLNKNTNLALGWISSTGVKVDPHIIGALYRHNLEQIDVIDDPSLYLKNKFNALRDNSDSFQLINDINNEFLYHQWADGSPFTVPQNVTTFNGSVYPSNYAHTASGIFLNTSRFSTIPQTADDLQLFAEFIDSSSIFLYGTRIQNLYSNGISRISRSSSLSIDGYGPQLVPPTPAIAYLLNLGTNSSPFDDINTGDDIIEFKPSQADMDSNSFDEQFSLVKIGDIVRINYGTVEVAFIIKEKKYKQESGNKKYIIRIAGKNLQYSPNASARIDKTLVNKNKYGVLAVAPANNTFSGTPSLIVGSPRGAQALGLGFNPDQFDQTHYSLYLALYPTGFPQDGYTILPPIDVTGNRGTTPGKYTLEGIVETTNNAFRQVGYNYRFIAFQYQGEFGIMLADSYLNSGFSILNAVVDADGNYDLLGTNVNFQNNVVGIFSDTNAKAPDPLGFSSSGSNIASPPFMLSYGSAEAALNPTKLFLPLKRNNYYVNGTEREKMNLEVGQVLDGYGDGYWIGTVHAKNIFPGPSPTGRVQTTYRIPLNLQESNLKIGKTIVIQSRGIGGLLNFGRFIIQNITFDCAPNVFTDIQVYDAVHGTAVSPSTTVDIGTEVAIYFNSDSISFNSETATDFNDVLTPFKRHFEIFVDQNSNTFTNERGRINTNNTDIVINDAVTLYTSTELSKLNIVKISPKLRGYQFGSVTKINLNVLSYSETTGQYSGQLGMYNGTGLSNKGPIIVGIKGEITRFYDETNIDYIDILFDANVSMNNFTNHVIDFQLFPTLSLDDEVMLLATCQYDTGSNKLSMFRDERQFGNTSEKEFSTSALNFISLPERLLHSNGVIRGFDMVEPESETEPNPFSNQIYLTGGMALVNGRFIQMNPQTVIIPPVKEIFGTLFYVNWILCVNDKAEYQPIPMLDYDAVLGTPDTVGRRFQAFNVVNGLSYYLDANVFSDVINKRKDLTPLYIVASQVIPSDPIAGPPTINMTLTDARKYVQDIDNNFPLKLTTNDSQGNFKDPEAIFNWLKYNNTFNSSASIKGSDSNIGLVSSDLILDYSTSTVIDGENDAILILDGNNITFGSNLTLKNMNVDIFGLITTVSSVSNLRFENCNIRIFVPETPPTDNVVFDIFNGTNISIEDCNIEVTYSSPYDSLQAFRGAVFRVVSTAGFKFINNSLSVQYSIVAGEVTPGDIFTISDTDDVIISGSTFSGNFNKCLSNELSDNLTFINSTITSSYCPDTGSPDSFNGAVYNSSDNVNSGQGWMYFSVTSTLNNIKIDNVTFNYSPTNTSYSKERYSFINFELVTGNCILSNLLISNCKFNNTITGGTNEDIRPAVAIINSANQSTANNLQPVLLNVNIYNNTCNRNQSIIVTSQYNQEEQRMVYPGLAAIGVNISNNICGTIGYWISSGSKVINISPNINNLIDKTVGLTIQNNTCHYISNLTEKGKYFRVSELSDTTTINKCDYPSGSVIIKNNKLNWIHVGISFAESSSLQIINNIFNAYNETYMEQFDDDDTTVYRGHGYAILVLSNTRFEDSNLTALGENPNNDSECIISGNIMSSGYWLQSNLTTFVYRYSAGYIYCQPSNSIHHNICKGIDDTTLNSKPPSPAFLISGFTNDVHHNKIYRSGKTISAYVKFVVSDFPELFGGGRGTTGSVVDNYFDSPFINGSNSENVIDIPDTSPAFIYGGWIAERNKNQTGFGIIPATNRALFGGPFPQWGPTLDDPIADILVGLMNDGGSLAVGPGSTSTGSYRSQSAVIVENTVDDPINKMWGFQESVEKYLPNNVRLISIKQGLKPWETSVAYYTNASLIPPGTTNTNFFLNLSSLDSTVDLSDTNVFSTVTSNDNNVVEFSITSPVYAQVTGGQINSTFFNIPLFIDLENYNGEDISNMYVTGRGKSITVSGDWRWVRSSSTLHITLSPIVVKYRW